jgi:hypothetical protein
VPTGIGITVTVLIMTTGGFLALDGASRISGDATAALTPEVIDVVASHASIVTVRFRPEADAASDSSRAIKAIDTEVHILI